MMINWGQLYGNICEMLIFKLGSPVHCVWQT